MKGIEQEHKDIEPPEKEIQNFKIREVGVKVSVPPQVSLPPQVTLPPQKLLKKPSER